MASSEVWKKIEDFPNYMVSSLGRVKSLNYNGTNKEKILVLVESKKGYLSVGLYKNKKYYKRSVHRLVAIAFIPNLKNKPQVNHKDGNKKNNSIYNLEWCDNRYNQIHAINKGLRKNIKPILQYSKDNFFIKKWKRPIIASKELGIDLSHILQVCKGERITAGGYKWKYEEGYYE